MKKVILTIMLLITVLCAQNILIPIDSLPPEIRDKYKVQGELQKVKETTEKMQSIAVNAEAIGKSIGGAMREGLGALTEESNKFAKTDVGKFTAVIIAWKVLGKDATTLIGQAVGMVVLVSVFIIFIIFWAWSFKRLCLPHKRHIYDIADGKKILQKIEYKTPEELRLVSDGDASAMLHWIILVCGCIVVFAISGAILF